MAIPPGNKLPRFAITLAMLDDDGKVIVGKSGGNDDVRQVTSGANFKILSRAFRADVKEWYHQDTQEERNKAKWTAEDQKVADERKAKLEQLQKELPSEEV